jgi:hypothetical protein
VADRCNLSSSSVSLFLLFSFHFPLLPAQQKQERRETEERDTDFTLEHQSVCFFMLKCITKSSSFFSFFLLSSFLLSDINQGSKRPAAMICCFTVLVFMTHLFTSFFCLTSYSFNFLFLITNQKFYFLLEQDLNVFGYLKSQYE